MGSLERLLGYNAGPAILLEKHTMAIAHLIAHRIQHLTPGSPASSTTRSEEIARDGVVEDTLREMKLGFVKKLTKIHGQFSPDTGEFPFAPSLKQHLEGKESFTSFTHRAIKHFEQVLSASEALIDAYVFFVFEKFEHTEEFYVYLVHHKNGQYLDADLAMTHSMALDTDNISLAAKLNAREWQTGDAHLSYLSLLVWRGEKELNEAFMQWLGFTNKANVKEQTDAFIEAVETYTKAQPEPQAMETREKVVNYCLEQDKAGKRVILDELSQQVNEENQKEFANFIKEQQPKLESELIPDRAQLRNYIRISGRNELLSMSFDSKCLGETIVYDADSESLTIKNIPSALKSRLLKHIQKSQGIG